MRKVDPEWAQRLAQPGAAPPHTDEPTFAEFVPLLLKTLVAVAVLLSPFAIWYALLSAGGH
jgi:hypothetical protein